MTDQRLIEFKRALDDGQIADALAQFDDVQAAFTDQEQREQALRTVARGIIARTNASDQANTAAQQYVTGASQAEQQRLQFNIHFMSFVGDNISAKKLSEQIQQVIDIHETVATRGDKLLRQKTGVPLPPLLSLFGPEKKIVPKGNRIQIEFSIENIGTQSISDITFTTEGYDLTPSKSTVASLDPDTKTSVELSGSADSEGEFTVRVRAKADDVAATHQLALRVLDKGRYLENTIELIENLKSRVEDLEIRGAKQGLLNRLETVLKQLRSIQNVIESGNTGTQAVNNRIKAVINELEAFNNQVRGLSGNQLTESVASTLIQDSSEGISTLKTAIKAGT